MVGVFHGNGLDGKAMLVGQANDTFGVVIGRQPGKPNDAATFSGQPCPNL